MAVRESFRDAQAARAFHRPLAARASKAASAVRARPAVYADIHPGVYKAFVAAWAALLVVFVSTFAESPFTLYMLAVVIGYAIMFFGVPYVMSRVAPPSTDVAKSSLFEFLRGEVQTLTGPVSGMEALMQVILVPLALAAGAIVLGYIVHLEADHIHMLYVARSGAFPQ